MSCVLSFTAYIHFQSYNHPFSETLSRQYYSTIVNRTCYIFLITFDCSALSMKYGDTKYVSNLVFKGKLKTSLCRMQNITNIKVFYGEGHEFLKYLYDIHKWH